MDKAESDQTCRSRTVQVPSPAFVLTDAEIETAYADGRGAVEFARRVESLVLANLERVAKAAAIECPCRFCTEARDEMAGAKARIVETAVAQYNNRFDANGAMRDVQADDLANAIIAYNRLTGSEPS